MHLNLTMKTITRFILLTLFISACKQKQKGKDMRNFDNFIFSYNEECCDYSIEFTNSDTIFIQKRFPRPKEIYFAIVENKDIIKLDSFLNAIDFSNYDTVCSQNHLQDGGSYKFYVTNDTNIKWTFIYGNEGPKSLYNFGIWLRDFKDRQKAYSIDTTINFGNLNYILLPEVPPPPRTKNSR